MTTIAELNDKLRRNLFNPGANEVAMTSGVAALSPMERLAVFTKIMGFNDFNEDNDPYLEHDFGRIEHNGVNYFFKIDYYAKGTTCGSDDPADESITTRVLTIMRGDEY